MKERAILFIALLIYGWGILILLGFYLVAGRGKYHGNHEHPDKDQRSENVYDAN